MFVRILLAFCFLTISIVGGSAQQGVTAPFYQGVEDLAKGHGWQLRARTLDALQFPVPTLQPLQEGKPAVGGGQRSNMATLVPLSERKFQFCYFLNTPGEWPTNSSYGINLSIQAWGR